MNNNYSKWLLVSDIDGTLNDKHRKLPLNNKISVNEFVSKGNFFTLCSGRNLQSLAIHYNKLGIKTPAIFLNGAGIYDFSTETILDFNPLSSRGEELILDIYKSHKSLQLTVYGVNTIYLVGRFCIYGYVISKLDKLDFRVCRKVSDLPRGIWGKVTFFGPKKFLKDIESKILNGEYSDEFQCFYTSPYGLEIVKKSVNKGSGVNKLTDILGVDKSNVAAIGDYYNDVDMLKMVCHPACCGQAPEDIKSICEYVTCHCNDGAVSDFINYLEKKYIY